MRTPSFFLVGAAGTGKTTLAKEISKSFGHALCESVTRQIADDMGGFTKINSVPGLKKDFQQRVMQFQFERLDQFLRNDKPFVAERSLDVLIHTSDECENLQQIVGENQHWESVLDQMKQNGLSSILSSMQKPHSCVVLFLRPSHRLNDLARAGRDGSLIPFLDWDAVNRWDAKMEFLLDYEGIPYIPVTSDRLKDRMQIVQSMLLLRAAFREAVNDS